MQKATAGQAPAQGSLFEVAPADGLDEAARDLERWERAGIQMVCVLDAEYPSNLRMVHQHPPVLFMRGTADERDATSVAVVGTRQPTPRGIDQARQLATGLAAHGVPVISGLAAGIDTAALTAALAAGGRVVAVIGTGIDRVYPPQNAGLQQEIAANGLVISQFLPGSPPTKASFPMRNAVMSGYTLATVVVEAATAAAPACRPGSPSSMAATCSSCAACSSTSGPATMQSARVSPLWRPPTMCSPACNGSRRSRRTSSGPDRSWLLSSSSASRTATISSLFSRRAPASVPSAGGRSIPDTGSVTRAVSPGMRTADDSLRWSCRSPSR